ncbi:hypothetical protein SERLADRAFT_437173 [Serpula lacrymans var. lacrymans S7.9]|uniref:Uncharacterized protein n=1 Tax=Serpula lacrymans var. lacrymans (strain S7.9) TaxID=578457 RepID=F8NSV1_SERL9|nr:uncharacterized protein SERLADRAFT_437173 [Serpula lacrymans var. lacrymans S7.9]EGO25424.1 hypothetical protein SERLADRAFT_437173 [Serpula lacrymans var. lacrymans S7.9]
MPSSDTRSVRDIAALFTTTVPPSSTPTPAPTVVVDLSTLVTILDYQRFYPNTPIASFHPVYYALDDGSLVAPPFVHDLSITNITLILIGILLALFVRNIIVSVTYIYRGRFKNKALLYTLLCSQLLALPCFIPLIVAQFDRDVDCGFVLRITSASTGLSLSLLVRTLIDLTQPLTPYPTQVTGILGVKAYRCLDNARLVLFALTLFRTASLIVLVVDLTNTHGYRRLSGRCERNGVGLTPVFIILLFVESLFICCCFSFAVWNSRGSPSIRGRISLQLSLEDVAEHVGTSISTHKQTLSPPYSPPLSRRGWWDYVPTLEAAAGPLPPVAPPGPDGFERPMRQPRGKDVV